MKLAFKNTRCWRPLAVIAAVLMVLMVSPALAANVTWDGPTTNNWWSNPLNWGTDTVPVAGDNAFLTNGTTATVNATSPPLLNSVIVDGNFTATQTYYPGGNLSTSAMTVGLDGIGVYNHSAGTNAVGSTAAVNPLPAGTIDRTLVLGFNNGSSGTYNKNGGTLTVWDLMVGRAGTGTFNQPYGSLTVDNNLILGRNASGNGTFNLSSGVLHVKGSETVGFNGVGEMLHSSGTHTIDGSLFVGRNAGSTGTFKMSSGSLQVGGNEIIGAGGDGTLTHTSGSHIVGGNFILGRDTGTTGNFTMTSGSLNVGGLADIGRDGIGNFTMTSGSFTVGGKLTLAKNAGSSGTFSITSGSVNVSDPALDAIHINGPYDSNIPSATGGNFLIGGGATINGNVTNDGLIKTSNANVTWNGVVTNNSAYVSDPGSKQVFVQDLVISPTGYLVATAPLNAMGNPKDKFIIKEDFISTSTQESLWDTHLALLNFNKGTDKIHDLYVTSDDYGKPGKTMGVSNVVIDHYAWGAMDIKNQEIHLVDGRSSPTGKGALYINFALTGVDLDTMNNVATNIFGPSGAGTYALDIYYNPDVNMDFMDQVWAYADGKGRLRPYHTPLPPSVFLMGSGLLGLGLLGWRRKRPKV